MVSNAKLRNSQSEVRVKNYREKKAVTSKVKEMRHSCGYRSLYYFLAHEYAK